MSYDLAFWDDPAGRYGADPSARYAAIADLEDDEQPSARLEAFITELEQTWSGASDDDIESSPWATWPLREQATASGIVVNLRFGNGLDVMEDIVAAGLRHGLVAYDPQHDQIYNAKDLRPAASPRKASPRKRRVRARSSPGMVLLRAVVVFGAVFLVLYLLGNH